MMRPTLVMRGSFLEAHTAPVLASPSTDMEWNLKTVKTTPSMPTRRWRYRIGPGEDRRTATAVRIINGAAKSTPTRASRGSPHSVKDHAAAAAEFAGINQLRRPQLLHADAAADAL